MIRTCTNGCTASTFRHCWSGAITTACSPRNTRLPISRLIPNAKVTIIPECGHVPHIEKPDVFAAEIETFLGARKVAA